MSYKAKVIADSISESGRRLTTLEVTFPRIVLAEFNTHRVFSRNSASSRAIPILTQLARIEKNPLIPVYWGKNKSGMQAEEELSLSEQEQATAIWLAARDDALHRVQQLLDLGVHKQITNRLLEPFMWHTVIVTATEWSNFFALRDNAMAQPEIHRIAHMMREVYSESQPQQIATDDWHLPYIQPAERDGEFEKSELARKISAARCARVSYLTHDGQRDLSKDLELYERLTSEGHMSPLEHPATPIRLTRDATEHGYAAQFSGNFRGWRQLRKFIPHEDDFSKVAKQ